MNGSNAWAKRRVYHAGDTKSQAIKEQNSEEWKKNRKFQGSMQKWKNQKIHMVKKMN